MGAATKLHSWLDVGLGLGGLLGQEDGVDAREDAALRDGDAVEDLGQLVVVEDCAQAWGARYQGELVGLKGDLSCYSFNDFKHLSCGDGGMVAANDDAFGLNLSKWGDKCYNRVTGIRNPDELALNYRMSEPLSAICTAQLGKHDDIVERSAGGVLESLEVLE